jgi:hypothetical protein
MNAGYSGTPLIKKLGIKQTDKLKLINAPEEYMQWLGEDVSKQLCKGKEAADFIHLFVKNKAVFEKEMTKILPYLKPTVSIWVSWYKKSSGIITDITETDIRNFALANQLVDIKVCAVSAEWSGLKLVIPVSLRKTT